MEYKLTENIQLFKAVIDSKIQEKLKTFCWFAFEYDAAAAYYFNLDAKSENKHIYNFTTTKQLRLLNVLSLEFRMDFWTKLNMNLSSDSHEKKIAMATLGLCSITDQEKIIRPIINTCSPEILLQGNLLGGHRCSSFDGDIILATLLQRFYGNEWDGYVIPKNITSCFHNGVFPSEICLFNTSFISKPKMMGLEGLKGGRKAKKPVVDKYLLARENIDFIEMQKIINKPIEFCSPNKYLDDVHIKNQKIFKKLGINIFSINVSETRSSRPSIT